MAQRKPLVLIAGRLKEVSQTDTVLTSADTIPWARVTNRPETWTPYMVSWTSNGSQTSYTLPEIGPIEATIVTVNGVIQRHITDYTISDTTLSLVVAPSVGSDISVRLVGNGIAGSSAQQPTVWTPIYATATGSSQVITLPVNTLQTRDVLVTLDGLVQHHNEYTIVGFDLNITAPSGVSICVRSAAFTAETVSSLSKWSYHTSSLTAISGQRINADTTTQAFTITLPSDPLDSDEIDIRDCGFTFATNNLTIAGNGKNIMGDPSTIVLDVNGTHVKLVYVEPRNEWTMTR